MTLRIPSIMMLMVLLLSTLPATALNISGPIMVSFLEKKALFRSSATALWEDLRVGQALHPLYEVKTLKDTLLAITLEDGSEIRVAPNSHLRISGETNPAKSHFDFKLMLGKAWATLRKSVSRQTKLILRTAHAKIDITGTSYQAEANSDETQVHVFTGKVEVSGESAPTASPTQGVHEVAGPQEIAPPQEVSLAEWHVIVAAFQSVSIPKNGQASKPTAFTLQSVDNAWVQWNLAKDKKL